MLNNIFPHKHNYPYVAIVIDTSHKVFIIPPRKTKHSQAAASGQSSTLPHAESTSNLCKSRHAAVCCGELLPPSPPPSPPPLKPAAGPSKSKNSIPALSTPPTPPNEKHSINNNNKVPEFWNVSGCLCNAHSGDNQMCTKHA